MDTEDQFKCKKQLKIKVLKEKTSERAKAMHKTATHCQSLEMLIPWVVDALASVPGKSDGVVRFFPLIWCKTFHSPVISPLHHITSKNPKIAPKKQQEQMVGAPLGTISGTLALVWPATCSEKVPPRCRFLFSAIISSRRWNPNGWPVFIYLFCIWRVEAEG